MMTRAAVPRLDTLHQPMKSCAMRRLFRTPPAFVLACLLAAAPVRAQQAAPEHAAIESPACRELDRQFALNDADGGGLKLNTALFSAADKGCLPLAQRLLDAGASLEARDRFGAMPLAHAARAGHRPLVELFLAKGAAIDARNLAGATALYAAAENDRTPIVALLLAKGADPNLPSRSELTPLAAAAYNGNDRIVADLLAHGAGPDAADATGKPPLVYAAARGFTPVVRRLLAAGIDPKRAYANDLTAVMWAAGYEDGFGERDAIDVITLLLDAGAPVDAVDNRGRTALMIAAEQGHSAVVDALLARGANPAIRDKAGLRAADLATDTAVRAKLAAK
jgi:uncharacterized protein